MKVSASTLLLCAFSSGAAVVRAQAQGLSCDEADAQRLAVDDAPYSNYFYSDCHSGSHVVVRNPTALGSGNENAAPRLIVAWPAGNSGIALYFVPESGVLGSLSIQLQNSTSTGQGLDPIYIESAESENPQVGISGHLSFNDTAYLNVSVLGSIRNIRDADGNFANLSPVIQGGVHTSLTSDGGGLVTRQWLDNITVTNLVFTPADGTAPVTLENKLLHFGSGTYQFNASFNYPQLKQLAADQVLDSAHESLIEQYPDLTTSLSFMSYTNKLLAGSWHYLTYFGRDTMLTLLLMQSVMSLGKDGAVEAAIGSVLERVSRQDGSTCHEETIGDYSTFQNLQQGIVSTAPFCDYKMIDTDYYLPVALKAYLLETEVGRQRADEFLSTNASFLVENVGLTYKDLASLTMERVVSQAAPFAAPGGQTTDNLIHLKDGQPVGEWRDSNNGIGGGRIPYDVNTALVPAALRAIAALARAGYFPQHPDWAEAADAYAQVWEDETLQFFEVSVPKETAVALVNDYVNQSGFPGPASTDTITGDVTFYGISLDGFYDQAIVKTMNSDDCFRHFLLNTTNQTQLTTFLSQTADHILQPFPVGLATDIGLLIANPALGGAPSYEAMWTTKDYHGTVVWSWQMAMMAAGLQRQLGRCYTCGRPDFCKDSDMLAKIKKAYSRLWDIIEANTAQLGQEAWSWTYDNGFHYASFGALGSGEGDVRQLWSLTFLAVTRQKF
ncbi:glycogen debranching enzyme [Thozetella sp. PMI_491]|nr:glycogen debranching enzyme [Thozetella sp. PMI_491]